MAHFKCRCGNDMDLSISPSEYEYTMIKNSLIDDIAIGIDEKKITSDSFYDIVDNKENIETIKCDKCERIWVWEGEYYRSYIKEPDGKQV